MPNVMQISNWPRIIVCVVLLVFVHAGTGFSANKWEEAIKVFEAADKENFPPEGAIVFTGSSSIRFWDTLERDMSPVKVINRGFGGAQMSDLIHYADRIILPYKPAGIVIFCGGVDIFNGKTTESVAADFRRLVLQLRTTIPGLPVYYVSIKPTLKHWEQREIIDKFIETNALIRTSCLEMKNIEYIDLWNAMLDPSTGRPKAAFYAEDQVHNSVEGNKLWTSIIKPYLLWLIEGNGNVN